MTGRIGSAGLTAAVVLLVCGVAISQVVPTQTGRRLDRNMQIGSGGYNAPSGGSGGVNSQLFVSGLIGGGVGQMHSGRLLDRSPQIGSGGYNVVNGGIGGTNRQLFMNRQVGALGLFRGDVPYRTLRAAPPAIGAPGATVAEDIHKTVDPALAKSLYADATADYASLDRVLPGQDISTVVPLAPLDARRGLAPQAPRQQTRPERPGTSALFGIVSQKDREQLAIQLQELPTDQPINARIGSQTWSPDQTEVGKGDLVTVAPGPLGTAKTRPATLLEQDQEVLLDILVEMQNLARAKVAKGRWPTVEPKRVATTGPGIEGAVERSDKEGVVIASALAGHRRNVFNMRLAAGQEFLKKGKYYSAAAQFDLAVTARPTNPLARIGRGLALLGAGEPLNAAGRFRDAIEVFPPIMETRFNFAEMTDAEHLKNRTTEVNRIVNAGPKPDTMLVFLSTYLAFNARSALDSKFYATKLAKAAGDDKILAAYAKFVLTGKRPDQADEKADKKTPK